MSLKRDLTNELIALRSIFSAGQYAAVLPQIQLLLAERRMDLPACHRGQLRIMQKVANAPNHFTSRPFNDALLWAFDRNGSALIIRRGLYKRLFPGKLTVTACGHGGENPAIAAAAFRKAFDLTVDPERLIHVGPQMGCRAEFLSCEFWAVTEAERGLLLDFYRGHGHLHRSPDDVVLEFSEHKQSLTAFVLSEAWFSRLQQIETAVTVDAGVPAIHKNTNTGFFVPYVVLLSETEVSAVNRAADASRAGDPAMFSDQPGITADAELAIPGRDQPAWMPWSELLRKFQSEPEEFAMDLCQPCLSNSEFIQQVESIL